MKIKQWIPYDKSKDYKEAPCGGMGGWFNFTESGQRWADYLEIWEPASVPYIEAIRASILKDKRKITGEYHQYGPDGVPVFEDNTVATFSYRAWGDLMAAIWSEAEDTDYSYMDFYM